MTFAFRVRLVLCGTLLLGPMSPHLRGQQLPLHFYSVKEGLVSNEVHCLAQDSHGYLWVGTSEGVSRFDGVSFTNYTTRDGLSFNYINAVLEPRESPGVVWLGTNGNGISICDQNRFTTVDVGDSPESKNVNALFQDHAGTIWVGTDGGMFRMKGGRSESVAGPETRGPVGSFAGMADGKILVAFPRMLGEYDPKTDEFRDVRLPLKDGVYIDRVWTDREMNVWIAMSDGVLSVLENSRAIERARIDSRHVYELEQDERGHILVGAMRGFFELQKSGTTDYRVHQYTEGNGLRDRFVSALLIDREGNFWMGTLGAGISKLGERDIALFPMRDPSGLLSQPAAAADTSGHLWAANASGLDELFHDSDGGWSIEHHDEIPDRMPQRIAGLSVDRKGKLWVNYVNGELHRFDIRTAQGRRSQLVRTAIVPSQFVHLSQPPAPVLVDRRGRLWYCCDPEHAVVLDLNRGVRVLRRFNMADSLPGTHITRVCEDSTGNVWIGGFAGGLTVFAADGVMKPPLWRFRASNGLPDDNIRALCSAKDGRVWIGTRYGGLASFSGGKFSAYGLGDGLSSEAVFSLAAGGLGRLWVGTSLGLQPFDPAGPIVFGTIVDLTGEMIGACGVARGEMVWGTTHQGLFVYETPHRRTDNPVPAVTITRLAVNGLNIPLTDGLTFSYEQDNAVVEFIGVSLRDGPSVMYQYRMAGLKGDWSPPTVARTVTFAALPPGEYRIQVRTVMRGNPSTGVPAELSFTIKPPFWRLWWFQLFAAACVLGTPWLFYRSKMRRARAIDKLRIRIASDLHDDIGSTLTKIAIQSEVIQAADRPDRITHASQEIGRMSREVVSTLSDMVWSIDARHDVMRDLLDRMRSFASGFLMSAEIEHSFIVENLDPDRVIEADFRHNVYLIFKESINNIVRHARASHVAVVISSSENMLVLTIKDDGVGRGVSEGGHGLRNMKMRAEQLGGRLEISGARLEQSGGRLEQSGARPEQSGDQGTSVTLRVPLGRKYPL